MIRNLYVHPPVYSNINEIRTKTATNTKINFEDKYTSFKFQVF